MSALAAGTAAVAAAATVAAAVHLARRSCSGAKVGKAEEDNGREAPWAAAALPGKVREIRELLRTRRPRNIEGLPEGLHELPPHIAKATWEELGKLLRAHEGVAVVEVPGNKWISLRLDGCGFSSLTRKLRRAGLLEHGFSPKFGEVMQACLLAVMETFHGTLGYSQSDEMTVLLRGTRVIRGEQQPHIYGGRVQKLCSIAASTATAVFNHRFWELAASAGLRLGEEVPLAHFDCRVGVFDAEEEALALVLWRAQDCGVNGVSDAVFHTQGTGKQLRSSGTGEKLVWLAAAGRLPLHRHQAYGSLFLRSLRRFEGVNPKTGERTEVTRRTVVLANDGQDGASRSVLSLAAQGKVVLSTEGDARDGGLAKEAEADA